MSPVWYAGQVLGDGNFENITGIEVDGIQWDVVDDAGDTTLDLVADAVAIDGDANFDGVVDDSDLSLLLSNFNATESIWADGDFDNDGASDDADLSLLLSNFNAVGGSALVNLASGELTDAGVAMVGSAVPEPSTVTLLAIGLGTLGIRRRRASHR